MRPTKRLEIVLAEAWLPHLTDRLDAAGLGYTVLPVILGHGDRGDRRQDDPDSGGNVFVICAVTDAEWEGIKEELRTILHDAGGAAIITEASWLVH